MTRARDTSRSGFYMEKTFPSSSNVIFRLNDQNLAENITVDSDKNAMVAGPLTVDSDYTLTIKGNLSIV